MSAKKLFVLSAVALLFVLTWHIAPFLFSNQTVSAQTEIKLPETKKSDVAPEVREKAVKLLASVARDTQQFAAPENRIKGQIVAADLLWEHDEKTARGLFQNALSEIQAILSSMSAAASEEEETENPYYYTERYTLSQLRQEFLLTLAPRDPKAALTALQSLRNYQPSKAEYDPLKDDELELQLAAAIAAKDPQQGYEVASKSLAKDGVTHNTLTTLKDLYKNSPETGAKFARDILAKLKSGKPRSSSGERITVQNAQSEILSNAMNSNTAVAMNVTNENFYAEMSMLAQFIRTASELNKLKPQKDEKKVPALTESEMRELAEFIGQTFARQQNAEPWSVASAMPLIAKYSPTASQLIRRKLNAQQTQMLESMSESAGAYEPSEDKTADEIAAEAEKLTSPTVRDAKFSEAARKALENNELERATEIAGKIKEKTSYSYVFDEIKTQTPVIKARRGDAGEVRKLLANLKTDEEKATTLTELIVAVAASGDKESAAKLLDEANQFLPSFLKRKPNLETTLKIAGAYAVVQPERAFNLIENSIHRMNELITAGVLIDEFYEYQTTKNDEVLFSVMERQGLLHTPNATALTKSLATADFDRAVSLADKFTRPEIRIFVRLKMAQSLLDAEAAENEKKLREQYENEHEH